MSRLWIALAWILVLLAADGAQGQSAERQALTIPKSVAGARFVETTDFEAKAPGLGQSHRFVQGGIRIDVFVYDLGLKTVPGSAPGATAAGQLAQASGDIEKAARLGVYKQATPTGGFSVTAKGAEIACRRFEIVTTRDEAVTSALCVTTGQNKFLKVRISGAAGAAIEATAERFIRGLLDAQ